MTPQDDWRPEMARLAQRQDQLERQQRDSTRNVEALKRDVDALNRDVDRRLDSLRREMDQKLRDGERRVSRLERSRDAFENLFWFSMPLAAAVAVIIVLVVAVIASREQRQELGEPEQRSPSSVDAPWVSSGGASPRGFVVSRDAFSGSFTARAASTPPRQPWPTGPGNYFLSILQPVRNGHRLSLSSIRSTVSSPSASYPGPRIRSGQAVTCHPAPGFMPDVVREPQLGDWPSSGTPHGHGRLSSRDDRLCSGQSISWEQLVSQCISECYGRYQ